MNYRLRFCEDASEWAATLPSLAIRMRIWDARLIRMTIASVLAGVMIGVVGRVIPLVSGTQAEQFARP